MIYSGIFAVLFDNYSIILRPTGVDIIDKINACFYLVPTLLVLWLLFPKKKVIEEESRLTQKEYKYGKVLFILFYVFSLALLIIILFSYRK